jgi:hypothetical protein
MSPTNWRKSSFSGMENCVEVAFSDQVVGVRDSKNVADPKLVLSAVSWQKALAALRG